jgi:hypothetical protein
VGAESWVAGIGEYLDAERVAQPVGDAGVAGLGNVGGAASATRPTGQDPSASIAYHQRFQAFCRDLPEMNW